MISAFLDIKSIKKVFGITAILLVCITVKGQVKMENNSVSGSQQVHSLLPASPTASLFSIAGQTSVSNFTGTANVSVPLYAITYKELNVDLSLSYQHGNGIKPEFLPGSFGNGWLLSHGGVITRISKGITPVSFLNPQTIQVGLNLTEDADWSSVQKMQNYIKQPVYILSNNSQYDEFSYSFGGLSGKFYTDYSGQRRFKSSQGEDLKVDIEMIPNPTSGKILSLPVGQTIIWQCPYKFTITDSRGVRYVFGGTDQSIELTRPGRSNQASPPEVPNDANGKNTVPVSWFLTSIQSPNGYQINLIYERGDFYVTSQSSCNGFYSSFQKGSFNPVTVNQPLRNINSSLINPCYIKKIITPISTTEFYWNTASQQLGYKFHTNAFDNITSDDPSWNPEASYCNVHFNYYPDVGSASLENRFPRKLDHFTVSDNYGKLNRWIQFNYTNDPATRLKLNSVEIRGKNNSSENAQVYRFGYNNTPLPDYLSFAKDAYGYYNGQNTYITVDQPNAYQQLFTNPVTRQQYIDSRSVNSMYSQAEILQKVTYPTGGYTLYEYENNDYSRVAQNWPAAIVENSGSASQIVAGLRIKKISNYDKENNLAGEKSYFYIKNYASGTRSSSGVLNYIPRFYEEFNGFINAPASIPTASINQYSGNLIYKNFGTDPINPISYNKNSHITYSEVTEVNKDNSYTVYKYKNYDNGYADLPPISSVYDNKNVSELWKEDESNSMELERGQLLSEKMYSSNSNIPQRETQYEYNDDPSRLQDNGSNIRMLKCFPNPISSITYSVSLRYIASLTYTYYPFLKRKTQIENENGNLVTNVINYTYNGSNKSITSEAITNSKQEIISTIYKYPMDMVNAGQTVPYSDMVSDNITRPVIIKEQYKNNTSLLNKSIANYRNWSGNIFSPEMISFQYATNSPELRQQIYSCDNYGNVQDQSGSNNVHETYLWGYKGLFPVAKIVGSDYATVSQYVDQNLLDNADNVAIYSDADVRAELNKLRINLPSAQVITMTYSPLVGITSQTGVDNQTIYYEYDDFSRLKLIRDKDKNILKRFCYNYAGQPEDCETVYYSAAKSKYVFSNTCTAPFTGSKGVLYSVPAGKYASVLSQTDADQQVEAEIQTLGQEYANANSECVSHVYVKLFYENPVNDGETRYDIIVRFYADAGCTQPASVNDLPMTFEEDNPCIISNNLLLPQTVQGSEFVLYRAKVLDFWMFEPLCIGEACPITFCERMVYVLPGNNYTIVNNSDFYFNDAQSQSFVKNNCPGDTYGSTNVYTVPAGKYMSLRPGSANERALRDVNQFGQSWVNANGTCQPRVYAKLTFEPALGNGGNAADIKVNFFSDEACTQAATVNNLQVRYKVNNTCHPGWHSYSETVSGSSYTLASSVLINYSNPGPCPIPAECLAFCNVQYALENAQEYIIVN